MSGERGILVWRLLFSVVMAVLLLGVFLLHLSSQRSFEVGDQAQGLANELSHTVFSALAGHRASCRLPRSVGGASYELWIENRTFVVRITGGPQSGNEYRSVACANLVVDSVPEPGEILYAQGTREGVVISAEPKEVPLEGLTPQIAVPPTDFYYFAKENVREACAIVAAYFYAMEVCRGENLDVRSYKWENEDSILISFTSSDGCLSVRATGYENEGDVGLVDRSWIVSSIESVENGNFDGFPCPSVENSVLNGWVYPPGEILADLLSKTWRSKDNAVVAVPGDVKLLPAAVTTNVSSYPAWRFEFSTGENFFVGYFGMLPWWPYENIPGFVFQSEPEMEVVE